jgi:hypothetical protein
MMVTWWPGLETAKAKPASFAGGFLVELLICD